MIQKAYNLGRGLSRGDLHSNSESTVVRQNMSEGTSFRQIRVVLDKYMFATTNIY